MAESGQVNIRLPSTIRDRLDAAAVARGLSRKELLRWCAGLAILTHEAEAAGATIIVREPDGSERVLALPA